MIRGSVLPLQRDGLWRLIRQRTGLFERGLRVIAEQVEIGTAGLPPVDGLLRDAGGSPVLLFCTDDRDTALAARVLAAHAFWHRNAPGMSRALPEADLRDGAPLRVVIVGVAMRSEAAQALRRLQIEGLEIVEVDTFRLGGQERIVVRGIGVESSGQAPSDLDDAVGLAERKVFDAFVAFVQRLDPKIRVERDRFSRRASYEGRLLGELWFADDAVHALASGGADKRIETDSDLRLACDQVARRYLQVHGPIGESTSPARDADASLADHLEDGIDSLDGSAQRIEAVRSVVNHSRLSREERDALMDPAFGREQEERTPGS